MGRSGAQYGQLSAANTWNGLNQFFGGARINGFRPLLVSKTANYTASVNDCTILVNATGGAVTVQLPFSGSSFSVWTVKKTDASVNAVTVQGVSGTIDGAATFSLAAQNNSVTVQGDGANGWILAKV